MAALVKNKVGQKTNVSNISGYFSQTGFDLFIRGKYTSIRLEMLIFQSFSSETKYILFVHESQTCALIAKSITITSIASTPGNSLVIPCQ